MVFLVLTRSGYEDLKRLSGSLPPQLWVNQGVLSETEVGQLRGAGTEVFITAARIDAASSAAIDNAVLSIQQNHGVRVWAEHPAPESVARQPAAAGKGAQNFRRSLQALRGKADAFSDRAWLHMKRFAASDGPVMILPYLGFGNPERLLISGRVLKDEGFAVPSENERGWRNFIELYKRLSSDEVPGARIRAEFQGSVQEFVTDRDGYFNAEIKPARPLESAGWQSVTLELVDPRPPAGSRIHAVAQVLVPPAAAGFGIISDIDDTVLWSNVTNKLRMLRMLAVANAHTRKPFQGVTAFYRALQAGAGGNEGNPVFYVSSSPWNLYTPLVDFFNLQGIPLGPLLLRDLGMHSVFSANPHHSHKLASIERIMETYPHLKFILIGDSGQQDPEIYRQVVERYPQRVRVIYIRNVNPDPARIEAIDKLTEEVRQTGAQLVLTPDSEYAAVHAAAEGLILADAVAEVRSGKKDDQ
ncbi:MAG: hypothetical protein JWQ23_2687 [Herminiimonas sp.]|nr:hypothetical protein [Herminiimonas sp.]